MAGIIPFRRQLFTRPPGSVLFDSFQSFLSGLGIYGRDKGVTTEPRLHILSIRNLQDLYRGDWLARINRPDGRFETRDVPIRTYQSCYRPQVTIRWRSAERRCHRVLTCD